MLLSSGCANQRAPSGPSAIPSTLPPPENWVRLPAGVMRPMFPANCPNQTAPSGPGVIPDGNELTGVGYSETAPSMLILPMLFANDSVNQRAPSGPAQILLRPALGVAIGYSVKTCEAPA